MFCVPLLPSQLSSSLALSVIMVGALRLLLQRGTLPLARRRACFSSAAAGGDGAPPTSAVVRSIEDDEELQPQWQ
jgi:hypothetical protein